MKRSRHTHPKTTVTAVLALLFVVGAVGGEDRGGTSPDRQEVVALSAQQEAADRAAKAAREQAEKQEAERLAAEQAAAQKAAEEAAAQKRRRTPLQVRHASYDV